MGELIGRLHPLIVHLPIGILVAAFLMELASRNKKFEHLKTAISFVLLMALVSALVSLFTGWIMPKEGIFDERLTGFHFWSSVSLTVVILLTYLTHKQSASKFHRYYRPLLFLSMILLTATGHFGGALTHGEDHLTKPLEAKEKNQVVDANTLNVYGDIITPILKQKCYSCHNAAKKKGGLIMSTQAGLMAGGDQGIAIVPGNVEQSGIISRLHLPLEDDEHMPPKGKKQLSTQEVHLLEWWIETGPSFDKLVGELEQSEEIEKILDSYETNNAKPNANGLTHLTNRDQIDLVDAGIKLSASNDASPFIEVSLSRDTTINNQKIKRLRKYADNITGIDLSHSNLDDGMLRQLSAFKNLETLKLQHTSITSDGLKHLKDLQFLTSLNVYHTQVSDEALDHINEMKSLRNLYLWQTEVSESKAIEFADKHPLVDVSYKINEDLFGDARLKPPIISAEQDIFDDTLEVSLSLNFSQVNVYYTLDGSEPDTNSLKYDKPFNIYKTSKVSAISSKESWIDSEIADKVYTKAGHKISAIKLNKQPSKKYEAKGAKSLIDFTKGTESFVDGNWLGYEGEDMTANLDLGTLKEVSNVVVGALEATGSYIFYPKGIEVHTSVNGQSFELKKKLDIPLAEGPHPNELNSFLLDFEPHETRYVKVEVFGTLKNPDWHPAPGARNWIFIDEIIVN